jgi:hypothetical protein
MPHSPRKPHASISDRRAAIRLRAQGFTPEHIAYVYLGGTFSPRSVRRWVRQYELTGVEKPTSTRPWVRREHYSRAALHAMDRVLEEKNGMRVCEVQRKVWELTGEAASLSTCRRAMRRLDWRHKRTSTVSSRQSRERMKKHAEVRELYHPRQYLFGDECHKRGKDLRRMYGWGKGSNPSIVPLSPHLGKAWTVLACFDYTGMVDWRIQELASKPTSELPKAVDRELWMLMFRECVLVHLNPCDERQLPRSVLVLDNCSLHWFSDDEVNEVMQAVQARGAKLLFIPQYCPRANAIEAGFSQMNKFIEADVELADECPWVAINSALLQIGPRYGAAFVRQSTKDVRSWL